MDCIADCIRRQTGIILAGVIIGAIVAALGTVVIACAALGGALSFALGPGAIGVTVTCAGVSLIALLPLVLLWALIGAAAGGLIALLVVLGLCIAECASQPAVAAGAPGSDTAGLVADGVIPKPGEPPLTCEAARAVVADLEAQLAAAIAERDAQADRVQRLARRVRRLTAAAAVAAAAVMATPFWNVVALAVAVVALAAALAALGVAQGRLLVAAARLNELNAKIAILENLLALARAARDALCGVAVTPGIPDDPAGSPTSDVPIGTGVRPR